MIPDDIVYNAGGVDMQTIMRRGHVLAHMLRGLKYNASADEREAVEFFITASYSPSNPPPGFTAETWEWVGYMDSKGNVDIDGLNDKKFETIKELQIAENIMGQDPEDYSGYQELKKLEERLRVYKKIIE